MPTIRNGRGELSVHDMSPGALATTGPGAIERRVDAEQATGVHVEPDRRVSRGPTPEEHARSVRNGAAARMARLAADRAAAAPPAPKPEREATPVKLPKRQAYLDRLRRQLTPRQQEIVDLLRSLGSRRAVQAKLGLNHLQSIDGALLDAHAKGLLPTDLPDLPRRLGGPHRGHAAKPTHIDRAGLTAAEHRRLLQGREAGAPATDADEGGAPGLPRATQVATPLDLTPPAAPDPPRSSPAVLPCQSCVHTAVCSIRPQLEAWVRNLKPPARPHPALQVVVSVDVVCEHYRAEA